MDVERTEQVYRKVVEVADRAVDRYRVFAGRSHPRPVADLLKGLVDEARTRAAEVDRAYFLVVGRPVGRIGGDGVDAGLDDVGSEIGETELLRRTLDDFRSVLALLTAASQQVSPGLPRRTLLNLVRSEETRIEAFSAVYRNRLAAESAASTSASRLPT
jgi:hypothetical protein